MSDSTATVIDWTEQGLVPDKVIRHGIRRLLKRRLDALCTDDCEAVAKRKAVHVRHMNQAVVAPVPQLANEQHYEVPAAFFSKVLGAARKYSCCYWSDGIDDLDGAEQAALHLSCKHAGL